MFLEKGQAVDERRDPYRASLFDRCQTRMAEQNVFVQPFNDKNVLTKPMA